MEHLVFVVVFTCHVDKLFLPTVYDGFLDKVMINTVNDIKEWKASINLLVVEKVCFVNTN